jgi:hypothetical protein
MPDNSVIGRPGGLRYFGNETGAKLTAAEFDKNQ